MHKVNKKWNQLLTETVMNGPVPVVKFLSTEGIVHIHNVASEKHHNPEGGKHRPLLLKRHPFTIPQSAFSAILQTYFDENAL